MLFTKAIAVAAAIGGAVAQRPSNVPICDYYTTALLKNNTAANQKTLLTLVVNTAVIGNYTKPNVGIAVPGILAPGMYNGTAVNLLPYFAGGLASTNDGGMTGVVVNFLDDGGAVPLMMNMPANGTSSNQYMLLTHLYEYFGALLGCSMMGTADYPAYAGEVSQYNVHKFMDLSYAQVGYFITQVALSAASFGVAADDLKIVGTALGSLFDYKCSPATVVIPAQGAQLQSICTGAGCPLDPMANCSGIANVSMPAVANSSASSSASASVTMSATSTSSSKPASASTAGAATAFPAGIAIFGAIVAYFL